MAGLRGDLLDLDKFLWCPDATDFLEIHPVWSTWRELAYALYAAAPFAPMVVSRALRNHSLSEQYFEILRRK
jgi:hypothetical protein